MTKKNDLAQRVRLSESNLTKIPYKRLYLNGNGKDYNLRFLSTEYIDISKRPYSKIWLHGGFFHPNYDAKYASTFRCLGFEKCPLCKKVKELKEIQKNYSSKEDKDAWKKQSRPYSLWWALNKENNELSLVHVPNFTFHIPKEGEEKEPTLHELLVKALLGVADTIDPLDFKNGCDVKIEQRVVNGSTVYDIEFETNRPYEVDKETVQKMKYVKKLQEAYPKNDENYLDHIARGEKIPYGNDAKEQENKVEKQKVSKEVQEEQIEAVSTNDLEDSIKALMDGDEFDLNSLDDESDDDFDASKLTEGQKKLRGIFSSDED